MAIIGSRPLKKLPSLKSRSFSSTSAALYLSTSQVCQDVHEGKSRWFPCVQCLGVSGTLWHLLLLRGWAMILPVSHSPFVHWSIVCSSFPSLSLWAPSRHHGPERGCQDSPWEASASSPGCRANCSVLSWPHAAATTAPRKEQETSFPNIKPSAPSS